MVHLSDSQQLPVRVALFALVTSMEMAMARRIEIEWPGNPDGWCGLLTEGRREKLRKAIASAKDQDVFVDEIALTQFADKAAIVRTKEWISQSKSKAKSGLSQAERLRNHLAHANHYAKTLGAAVRLPTIVRTIVQMKGDLGT